MGNPKTTVLRLLGIFLILAGLLLGGRTAMEMEKAHQERLRIEEEQRLLQEEQRLLQEKQKNCPHQSFTGNICDDCGWECPHKYWTSGVCDECGEICYHEHWQDGFCLRCGQICSHTWKDGVCRSCHMKCTHRLDSKGKCGVCGWQCPHERYQDGICMKCGYKCRHQWKDGVCPLCGLVCKHEHHDRQTRLCAVCGTQVLHTFIDGACECGEKPYFYESLLSPGVYGGSERHGTVDHLSYQSVYPEYDNATIRKNVNIYLPYGYDESKQYDVLVMVHGGGGNEYDWTDGWHYIEHLWDERRMVDIYDFLIDQQAIKPLIVVSPATTFYLVTEKDSDIAQFARELRDVVLPYVCTHYATYAKSGNLDDIRAARAHFGIGGDSNGALYALDSGMQMNLDIFSNFIALSGNNQPELVATEINKEEWKDLPIYCFYTGAGIYDGQRDRVIKGYERIVNSTDRLTDGKNAFCVTIYDAGHDWMTWTSSMVNALQVVFPHP